MVPEGESEQRHLGTTASDPATTARGCNERLQAIEAAIDRLGRRQVVACLRAHPADLLAGAAGAAGVTKIVREDVDELAELLARWDLPLSPAETQALRGVALLAQGTYGPAHASLYLVIDVVSRPCRSDLERLASAAQVLSTRSRRTLPVLVTLHEPEDEVVGTALSLGIELVVDP